MIDLFTDLLAASRVTLVVTLLGGIGAVVVAVVTALGRLSGRRFISGLSSVFVEVFRGTSFIVQIFWLFYVLPEIGITLDPLTTGVLAMAINVGAYGSEVVRGAILAVPNGQLEAASVLGMGTKLRLRFVVLPQAVVAMIPPWSNLFVQLLKGTSALSLISLTEITFQAQVLRSITGDTTRIFVATLVVYFMLNRLLSLGFQYVENRIARSRRTWRPQRQRTTEKVLA